MSIEVFCQFFNQVTCLILNCMISLYLLDSNPLSDISYANIFSHSVVHLFIVLVSFAMKKLLLIFAFIFAFVSLVRGERLKRVVAQTYIKEYIAYIFFKTFYGFQFYTWLLIYFDFTFVYDVRKCSNFFLYMLLPVSPTLLNEETVFSSFLFLPTLS